MANIMKRVSHLPFVPIVAGMFALVAAVLVMATPIWLLENAVGRIGLQNMVSAAAPPLGMKARALLALLAAFGTGGVLWSILSLGSRATGKAKAKATAVKKPTEIRPFPLPQDEDASASSEEETDLPRRRRPILADRELGAPFMSDEALATAPILPTSSEVDYDADELVLDQSIDVDQEPGFAPIYAPAFTEAEAEPVFAPSYAGPVYAQHDHAPAEALSLEAPEGNSDTFETVEPFEPASYSAAPAARDFTFEIPVAVEPEIPPHASNFEAAQPVVAHVPLPPPIESHTPESLSDLVDRVERGMEHRSAAIAAAKAAAEAAVAVQAVEQAPMANKPTAPLETAQQEVDSALRQALNTLERLAASSR